jgi:diguanylate cyclase (GGDEF)-like protein
MSDHVAEGHSWRRRGSMLLVFVVVTATVGMLGLVVQSSVFLGQLTSEVSVAQGRATNLSNTQRETLRLLQSLTEFGEGTDAQAVTVQRGLMGRQLRVSLATFPAKSPQARDLEQIQTAVGRFPWDRLSGRSADAEVIRRTGMALISQSERRIKALFDEQEKSFYSANVEALAAKHRSQTSIGVLVSLVLVMVVGGVVMLKRQARNDVARAYAALVAEMKERQVLQEHLAHQAAHDPLTELANRARMLELIEAALHRGQRGGTQVGLLFIDLDYFKIVNDTLGHRAGDDVLRTAADRMRDLVRAGDTVGRLGGDEFVVLLEPLTNPPEVGVLAARLITAISAPMTISDREVTIGASIGVAVTADGSTDANQLLHHADVAAYRAKAGGRGRAELFDDALRRELEERAGLEAAIRAGLAADEFLLHYQPVIELRTGDVSGYEALVRWQRPEHGLVPPDSFIPTAEQSTLICDIDRWVLEQATAQLAEWTRFDPHRFADISMAVNISGRHLASPDIVTDVAAALEAAGVPATRLVLEITETVLVDEPTATAHLRALRALGVSISIDDFGTGYTSIGQLQHLHVDILKIDRSFTGSSSPGTRELVTLMINAGHAFGLHVVAEGIEQGEQLGPLMEMACDSAQGYYFARPLPASEIVARLATGDVA